MSDRSEFRFAEHLRVRWSEVDAQKIVFNAHYLTYLDTAMAGYWRALALPYAESMALLQGDLVLRKSGLEYEVPARYDDLLQVGLRCARIGNSSLTFDGAVFRAEQRLTRAELVYVFADTATMRARPVPGDLRELLLGFEAGKPMLDVRVGSWDQLGHEARAIRSTVFIDEQKIPADMEWDAADASCVHAVAFNRLGMALATGRLLEHVPGTAKVGRMAVLPAMRGTGIGRALLEALMAQARQRGQRDMLLHAQAGAEAFYQRLGFHARGPRFEEAGIVHVEMLRSL